MSTNTCLQKTLLLEKIKSTAFLWRIWSVLRSRNKNVFFISSQFPGWYWSSGRHISCGDWCYNYIILRCDQHVSEGPEHCWCWSDSLSPLHYETSPQGEEIPLLQNRHILTTSEVFSNHLFGIFLLSIIKKTNFGWIKSMVV